MNQGEIERLWLLTTDDACGAVTMGRTLPGAQLVFDSLGPPPGRVPPSTHAEIG